MISALTRKSWPNSIVPGVADDATMMKVCENDKFPQVKSSIAFPKTFIDPVTPTINMLEL